MPEEPVDETERLILMRKMLEMQRKLLATKAAECKPKPEASDRELVLEYLVGRAKEVLEAAERQYPTAAKKVVSALARAIRKGRIKGPIDGYDLYELFRYIGLPVRLETRLYVERKGERKSLSEALKESLD